MTAAAPRRWWTQSTELGEVAVTLGPHGVERIELPSGDHHIAEDEPGYPYDPGVADATVPR